LGLPDTPAAIVVRIANTLSLEIMQVAEAFSAEITPAKNLTALGQPGEMEFDSQQNLLAM
jgi:hypothetical protein